MGSASEVVSTLASQLSTINNWMIGLHVYLVHRSCFHKNVWVMGAGLAMMFSLEKGCAVLLTLLSNFGVAKIHMWHLQSALMLPLVTKTGKNR